MKLFSRSELCVILIISLHIGTQAASDEAGTVETGWSNGGKPESPNVPVTLCPNKQFIESWIVGEGNVSSNVGPLLSIVFVQARCSDGSLLPPIQADTPIATKHDHVINRGLSSVSGYTCPKLLGYNNGGNWMMNFLGLGQQLAKDAAGTPLKLDCAAVPPSHVAVGYGAGTGGAVDAINFIMGPAPTASSATAPTRAPAPSPASSAAALVPQPPSSPAPAPPPASPVAPGAIVGIAVSGLVGLSAVVTSAYNLWKWVNKRELVKAKQLPR